MENLALFYIKILVRMAAGRGYSYFHLLYKIMPVGMLVVGCTGPPSQTKNYTDQKFGTHTPLDHI